MANQEQSLFEQFPDAFSRVTEQKPGINNPRDRELLTILRDEREKNLSSYAFHT